MDSTAELLAELKQTKPWATLEEEVGVSIARTAAVVEHAFADAMREYGITPTQYNVLRILRGAGQSGLCRNELRDRLVAPVPDATRLLDRMVEMKLVTRERDAADKRFVTARITKAGLDLLNRLDKPVQDLNQRQFSHLGPAKLRQLIDLLAEVRRRE